MATHSSGEGNFQTVESEHRSEIIIKKSRFIGHVVPVKSVEDAETALELIRLEHKAATHNCFAYTVGLGVPVERFSDDGEPSGTAGRPILEVIRRKSIMNVLVVVTRYFGGVLLGASGLVRAYADGCATVLDDASILTCQPMHRVNVDVDYAMYGKLEYELGRLGYTLQDKVFETSVRFFLWMSPDTLKDVTDKLENWSNGNVQVSVEDPIYVGLRDDGSFIHGVWP